MAQLKSRVHKLEDARRKRKGSGVLIVTEALEAENAGLWHGQAGNLYTEAELDALAQDNVQLVKIVYSDNATPSEGTPVRTVTFDDVFGSGIP